MENTEHPRHDRCCSGFPAASVRAGAAAAAHTVCADPFVTLCTAQAAAEALSALAEQQPSRLAWLSDGWMRVVLYKAEEADMEAEDVDWSDMAGCVFSGLSHLKVHPDQVVVSTRRGLLEEWDAPLFEALVEGLHMREGKVRAWCWLVVQLCLPCIMVLRWPPARHTIGQTAPTSQ